MTEQTAPARRTEEEIRATVAAVISDMAPKDGVEVTAESHLIKDLGYHSLALMEVAFAIEDEFDLDPIDEDTARKITTVGAVQDLVVKRLAERDGA
ncbi:MULTISPECIES: phosphopantetheine-binding protein [Micromonospora]|uniref:Phosphopantetheine-binding protein n=2 Tax=Micromonospora TaxID=1873 RepID=A0A9X0I6P0_9ACTN|nr:MULTISPECIES: phosphopantetheine-binding protein [Micromonospora]AEB42517.1 phosphopantetheine-binding protein [Micromonospora maris AB-18-032]AIS85623.1 phosphopantetheine-binding protein [Verrucosispora sp. MS100047]KUJ47969.1 phosphopantetheine-binding protein [Micromonospora maris]RUL92476.1 acyl carrier protein [Verrucosispora sp. FIM060022]